MARTLIVTVHSARCSKIGLVLAWIFFLILTYRVSLIEIEHKEYDPFGVLNVDRVGSLWSVFIPWRIRHSRLGSNDRRDQTGLS